MTFWQWVLANKGAILAFLVPTGVIIGGALYRALPAKAADWNTKQIILDFVRGVLQALPQQAPKLVGEQRAAAMQAKKG